MISTGLYAQKRYDTEYGIITGVSNYLGEIGGRQKEGRPFIADLKLAKTRWNEGVYYKYRFHPMFAAKISLNYLRIEGDDKLSSNPARKFRNLSFRNDIYDAEATLQWLFYSKDRPTGLYPRTSIYFAAYLFAGVGGYYSNPKTKYQGSYIALRPLKTEGVAYSAYGLCVPFGAGFYVTINRRLRAHRIGFEFNWRYTTSDRLDDISSDKWGNPAELPSATAVALNNRNPEVTSGQPDGFAANYGWRDDGNGNNLNKAPRGNPKNKDSYISVNLSYGIVLKARYSKSRGKKIRSVSF